MAIFGLKININPKVLKFMQECNERLQDENLVRNPFKGKIKKINQDDNSLFYVILIEPVYPKIHFFGFIVLIVGLIISGFTFSFWLLPGIIMIIPSIMWTKYFYFISLYIGLRKNNYKETIRMINNKDIIKMLI